MARRAVVQPEDSLAARGARGNADAEPGKLRDDCRRGLDQAPRDDEADPRSVGALAPDAGDLRRDEVLLAQLAVDVKQQRVTARAPEGPDLEGHVGEVLPGRRADVPRVPGGQAPAQLRGRLARVDTLQRRVKCLDLVGRAAGGNEGPHVDVTVEVDVGEEGGKRRLFEERAAALGDVAHQREVDEHAHGTGGGRRLGAPASEKGSAEPLEILRCGQRLYRSREADHGHDDQTGCSSTNSHAGNDGTSMRRERRISGPRQPGAGRSRLLWPRRAGLTVARTAHLHLPLRLTIGDCELTTKSFPSIGETPALGVALLE